MAAGFVCEVTSAYVPYQVVAGAWRLAMLVKSHLPQCFTGPVAGPWLLAVLVRSQQPQCLIGQWEANGYWLCM